MRRNRLGTAQIARRLKTEKAGRREFAYKALVLTLKGESRKGGQSNGNSELKNPE